MQNEDSEQTEKIVNEASNQPVVDNRNSQFSQTEYPSQPQPPNQSIFQPSVVPEDAPQISGNTIAGGVEEKNHLRSKYYYLQL